MKISVRPGKRDGLLKTIFNRQVAHGDFDKDDSGAIVLTIVAEDIYTNGATQRYSITLDAADIEMILERPSKTDWRTHSV